MESKTCQEIYDDLDDDHKNHVNAIVDHYNTDMHPTQKAILRVHASNNDHDSMVDAIQAIGKTLGITFSTAGVLGVSWWVLKQLAVK